MDYYLLDESRNQIGPYSPEGIRRQLESGELTPHDQIWREGLDEWVSIATEIPDNQSSAIPSFSAREQQSPPVVETAHPPALQSPHGGAELVAGNHGEAEAVAVGSVLGSSFFFGLVWLLGIVFTSIDANRCIKDHNAGKGVSYV